MHTDALMAHFGHGILQPSNLGIVMSPSIVNAITGERVVVTVLDHFQVQVNGTQTDTERSTQPCGAPSTRL